MRKKALLIILFLLPLLMVAQLPTPQRDPFDNRNEDDPISNKNLKVEGEKPPITDYLIISQRRDTTFLDTTLTIQKEFKFNYLRKDNFELMPFHNIGQPYNRLSRSYNMELLSPRLGASARHSNYMEIDDVYDYYVPTPLSDLYFKTVVNQGQQSDMLFTTNLSPQFNFSISYKGLRSAGNYVNSLTSTGNFKFTSNYFTKDKKYRLRLHTTFQDLLNEENGGLDPASLEGFINEDDNFDDRGRLETNLDNAESLLEGKRFYIDQDYEILGDRDSTSYYSARVYNKMYYEDKFYRYSETSPTTSFLGAAYTSGRINNQTDLKEGKIELGLTYDHHILGFFKAGLARKKFNYGYNRAIQLVDNTISNRLIGELYQFHAEFDKRIGKFDFNATGGLNVAGDLDGQFLKAIAGYQWNDVAINASLAINSRAPDFNYLLFQSDYINYNWQNSFNNVKKQELNFNAVSKKYFDLDITLSTIQDQVYFMEQTVVNGSDVITGYNARPFQADFATAHLKVKLHKEFTFFEHFGMDNTVMYQQVSQDDLVTNVPEFTTRNSLYYTNRFFKNDALQLQTGITFKYFTSYNMDGYDPVLGEFYVQDREEFGNYPLIDLFVNAKVRQTRIFFKVEHANAPFAEHNYFSAPRVPFRDLTIRFGLVWNFFL
jgi:hypothetical protein